MSKKSNETRKYIFYNPEAPQLMQSFSRTTLTEGTWKRTLVPGATVELTDWEYDYIINQCAKDIPMPQQDIDSDEFDVNRTVGKAPRFQLQPVL